MLKLIRKIIKKLYISISKLIIPLFFSKEYLGGKWFKNNTIGWRWAWKGILWQKVLGFNRYVPWPVAPHLKITDSSNIIFHVDDINNFQNIGCYFQSIDQIVIGEGTYIGPNVGIITANHDPYKLDEHLPGKKVILGEQCWIGMNSVILPGIILGDNTIVGAGSVVTKSFTEGNCIIAGNPAKIIKKI